MIYSSALRTQAQVLAEAARLLADKWRLVPCDDIYLGMRGIAAIRGTAHRELQWPIFDRPLIPEVKANRPSRIWEFICENEQQLIPSHDLEANAFVFILYDPKRSASVVRRVTVLSLASLDRELAPKIMTAWEKRRVATKEFREVSTRAITALMAGQP